MQGAGLGGLVKIRLPHIGPQAKTRTHKRSKRNAYGSEDKLRLDADILYALCRGHPTRKLPVFQRIAFGAYDCAERK